MESDEVITEGTMTALCGPYTEEEPASRGPQQPMNRQLVDPKSLMELHGVKL